MARNKLNDKFREQQADKHGGGHGLNEGPGILDTLPAHQTTPSQIVAHKDLLQEVRRLLSDDERLLLDARSLGRDWAEIAREVGGQPNALRMKLTRALNRVARQLGLEEVSDD
jgi:DNA-directed RNA polymerase specialized sigma24 family protein